MKHTIDFLTDLSKNNNRDWFQANKNRYQQSYDEMLKFVQGVIDRMNKHDLIETPNAKKSLFRIYRDVRFSKDKSPYKTHWAGSLRRATAALRGGYYYHIGPDRVIVAGGFFGPNAEDLKLIRDHIAQDPDSLKDVISSKEFVSHFGTLEGEQLKTAPKGFDKDHPEIELLRYKQFLVTHEFRTSDVLLADFADRMAAEFMAMRPFFDVMSDYLTTDLNGISLID